MTIKAHYYEAQQPIEYGFTDFMGGTWCDAWVDTYNQLTADINKSANMPVYSDSLTQQERDFFLDQRNRTFVQYMEILNKAKSAA